MIQSHLPVPVTVQIETRSLKTVLSRTIDGKGEKQQLYCPGTFEHFHQLTFQLEYVWTNLIFLFLLFFFYFFFLTFCIFMY